MNQSKHIVLVSFLLFCLIGLAGVVVLASRPGRNAAQAQRVSSAVQKIPVGTSKAQIAIFLAHEKLHFNSYRGEDEIDHDSEVLFNGYTSADLSSYCVATIRDTAPGLLASGDTEYYFFFDKKGKLLKATTKEVWTRR